MSSWHQHYTPEASLERNVPSKMSDPCTPPHQAHTQPSTRATKSIPPTLHHQATTRHPPPPHHTKHQGHITPTMQPHPQPRSTTKTMPTANTAKHRGQPTQNPERKLILRFTEKTRHMPKQHPP